MVEISGIGNRAVRPINTTDESRSLNRVFRDR